MKKLITAMLAAGLLIVSAWAAVPRPETANPDRYQNKGLMISYEDPATGRLIILNARGNSSGAIIVEANGSSLVSVAGAVTVVSATLATEATVATLATEATAATLATEATAATLATEATLAAQATAANQATLITNTGNIDTNTTGLAGTVSGAEQQVDIVAALPAGTNAIGKLAANDGVDVGDATINNAAGASAVNVQDGGNSLTVDGTLSISGIGINSANIQGAVADGQPNTGNPVGMGLQDGSGDLQALLGDTSGRLTIGDISGGTQTNDVKVTLDSEAVVLGAGAASIGTLGANSGTDVGDVTINNAAAGAAVNIQDGGNTITVDGTELAAIQTAVEIMDDWDAVSGGGISTDGPQVMGHFDSTKPTGVDDGDAVQMLTDEYGRPLAGVEPESSQVTFTSADATTAAQVIAATAAKKIYIRSLTVSTDTALNMQFQDSVGPTVLIEQMYFAANGGVPLLFPAEAPLVVNTNEDFDVITSVAGNISVTVTYYLAP